MHTTLSALFDSTTQIGMLPLDVWSGEDLFEVEPIALTRHPLVERAREHVQASLPLLDLGLQAQHPAYQAVSRSSSATHDCDTPAVRPAVSWMVTLMGPTYREPRMVPTVTWLSSSIATISSAPATIIICRENIPTSLQPHH